MLVLLAFINLKAQDINTKKNTLINVFNNLVNAYGNAKTAPALDIVPKASGEKYIATYIATPNPVIKVDEQLFDLCMQMGTDSLNALSIILSHELAHYYNDHSWCSDFAFAVRNKIKSTKDDKITHEREADNFGLYHSCIAGYHPFGIYNRLLDKIYTDYALNDKNSDYPTKSERKLICKEAEKKIRDLYPVFEVGIAMLQLKYYAIAADCFQYLTMFFPSRDVYNNLGVCRLFEALDYKPYDSVGFIYPIEIDPVSRIYQSTIRGIEENGRDDNFRILSQESKVAFEKAISLDPHYLLSHLNLACLYDVKGNSQAAIGEIAENSNPANSCKNELQLIKAIALYHSGDTKEALKIFLNLSKINNPIFLYNNQYANTINKSEISNIDIENWKDEWVKMNVISDSDICDTTIDNWEKITDSTHVYNRLSINQNVVLKTYSYSHNEIILLTKEKSDIVIIINEKPISGMNSSPNLLYPNFIARNKNCLNIQINNSIWKISFKVINNQ